MYMLVYGKQAALYYDNGQLASINEDFMQSEMNEWIAFVQHLAIMHEDLYVFQPRLEDISFVERGNHYYEWPDFLPALTDEMFLGSYEKEFFVYTPGANE